MRKGELVSEPHRTRRGPGKHGRLPAAEEAAHQAARIKPEIAILLEAVRLDALSEPEFRVLSVMGERKGIRLEAIFWQALEQIAANLHVSRNTLVLWIMTAAGNNDRHNVTSVLRSVAVAYLLADIERLKLPPSTTD